MNNNNFLHFKKDLKDIKYFIYYKKGYYSITYLIGLNLNKILIKNFRYYIIKE